MAGDSLIIFLPDTALQGPVYIIKKKILLYQLLKIQVRIASLIFCRRFIINKPGILHSKGPLLLACNHPNSFLDGVLLDILFDQPLYSLARGDVFKRSFYARLLFKVKLIPIYRLSEGAENIPTNYESFEACKEIFRKNGIVIMFSEGKCINEWHLRPLKKGTARLAFSSWEAGIPLQVLPVGINYSSFRRFGKNMFINFGDKISQDQLKNDTGDGLRYQAFNDLLEQQLKTLVFEIGKEDKALQEKILERKPSVSKKIFLSIPSLLGWLLHVPLYMPIQSFTYKRTHHNDHFDSVLTAILLFAYPVYIIVLTVAVFFFTHSWLAFLLILVMPLLAWSYVQLKPQLDK
ncbi:MAG TPA: 1-acyl-sn-glycerol-3-phosphate acyltransferase [Chitinophagaceae bacterium]|nr:1-acyl-sn-glycerol-3-phosphate acyltransferase [Chitinophagaceae bacterium]